MLSRYRKYSKKKLDFDLIFLGVWGFISSPHFLQSDMKFREDVHGMQPDPNKHEFIMSFEPVD
jgi:hypothetical protein